MRSAATLAKKSSTTSAPRNSFGPQDMMFALRSGAFLHNQWTLIDPMTIVGGSGGDRVGSFHWRPAAGVEADCQILAGSVQEGQFAILRLHDERRDDITLLSLSYCSSTIASVRQSVQAAVTASIRSRVAGSAVLDDVSRRTTSYTPGRQHVDRGSLALAATGMVHCGAPILVLLATFDWVHLRAKEISEKMKHIGAVKVVCAALAGLSTSQGLGSAAPSPLATRPATVNPLSTRPADASELVPTNTLSDLNFRLASVAGRSDRMTYGFRPHTMSPIVVSCTVPTPKGQPLNCYWPGLPARCADVGTRPQVLRHRWIGSGRESRGRPRLWLSLSGGPRFLSAGASGRENAGRHPAT